MQAQEKELTAQKIAELAMNGKSMPRSLSGKERVDAHQIIIESNVQEHIKRSAYVIVNMGSAYKALEAVSSTAVAFSIFDQEEVRAVRDQLLTWRKENRCK